MNQQLRVIACCRVSVRETDIFRLWILHYAPHVDRLGAVIVAEADDNTKDLESLCSHSNVEYRVCKGDWFHPRRSMAALKEFVKGIPADWIVHADSDEFLYEIQNIRACIGYILAEGADHAIGWMADRLAFGGRLGQVDRISCVDELEAAFPVRAAVTEKLALGCPYKVCLCRWPFLGQIHKPGPELHKPAKGQLILEHFKWRIGLEQRLAKRIKDHAASGLPWGCESERILQELQDHGRIRAERLLAPRSHRIPEREDIEDIYLEAVERAPENGHLVEIGVGRGGSLCFLAEAALAAGKRVRIDGVDAFRNSKAEFADQEISGLLAQNSVLDEVAMNLRKQGMLNYINLIQVPSRVAARLYEPESLDFVFLDEQQRNSGILPHLEAWWPKIKSNGRFASREDAELNLNTIMARANPRPTKVCSKHRYIIAIK